MTITMLLLAASLSYGQSAGSTPKPVPDASKAAITAAKSALEAAQAKVQPLIAESQKIATRQAELQQEYNAMAPTIAAMQRKYDAAIEAAYQAAGIASEEEKWDFDASKMAFIPKLLPPPPAATPASK